MVLRLILLFHLARTSTVQTRALPCTLSSSPVPLLLIPGALLFWSRSFPVAAAGRTLEPKCDGVDADVAHVWLMCRSNHVQRQVWRESSSRLLSTSLPPFAPNPKPTLLSPRPGSLGRPQCHVCARETDREHPARSNEGNESYARGPRPERQEVWQAKTSSRGSRTDWNGDCDPSDSHPMSQEDHKVAVLQG